MMHREELAARTGSTGRHHRVAPQRDVQLGMVVTLLAMVALLPLTFATNASCQGALAVKATLTSPTLGTTLPGANVTFTWDAGVGVTQYWLYVGSSPAGYDLFTKPFASGTLSTSVTLPTDGRAVYVRLFSQLNEGWYFNDYTYTAPILSPVAGFFTFPDSQYPIIWAGQTINSAEPVTQIEFFNPLFGQERKRVNPVTPVISGDSMTFLLPGEYYLKVNGKYFLKAVVLSARSPSD